MHMRTTRQQLRAAPRILAGLLFAFMAAMASVVHASPSPSSWNGQPADIIVNTGGNNGSAADQAILIKDAAELAYFAKQVNAGGLELNVANGTSIDNSEDEDKGFSGLYFALSADIDLEGHDWIPIGEQDNPFKGHFDGDGHVVKGLKVSFQYTEYDKVYAGLFGHVKNGTLCNLGVWLAPEGIDVSSEQNTIYAGGLVGMIITTSGSNVSISIRNCYVEAEGSGKISARNNKGGVYAGGIAGDFYTNNDPDPCLLIHCYSTVDVEAISDNHTAFVGGIVGQAGRATISYSYATGNIKGEGKLGVEVGGICGFMTGTITNCLALNKSISGTSEEGSVSIARILGSTSGTPPTLTANFASPRMTLNGSTTTSNIASDRNGALTWSDKLKEDLLKVPAEDNEWKEAWNWTDEELPKLKKLVDAENNTYDSELSGQTTHSVKDYLSHSPWADAVANKIENAEDGTGSSPDAPILIEGAAELAYLAQQVNAKGSLTLTNGKTILNNNGFPGYYFALSADIDLEGGNWTPIGNSDNTFKGHFDGRGHTVKGLTVHGDMSYAGLFGFVVNGTLCNLGVSLHEDGIKVSSVNAVQAGGIVGMLHGYPGDVSLRNCYVVGNGKVEGTSTGYISYVGGIAGAVFFMSNSTASLTHCYATVAVEAEAEATSICGVGGIVGVFSGILVGTLSHTYATGSVKASGGEKQYAGGICGFKENGNLTRNLALNSEVAVESGSDCHRIVGYDNNPDLGSISSNYARPAMSLNGQPVTSTDTDSFDGSDTWLDTYKADLGEDPVSDNSWKGDNWTWTDSNLPQLRMVILDAGGTPESYEDWPSTQAALSASSFLTNKPAPTPPPKPDPEPTPPTVYYTVTLPAVEGAITDPAAGTYEVESWSTFRFYLTLDTAYSESQPVVTTSRYETLAPRSSDGAYLLKYVRNDVEVYIDGIVKNPDPVANETLATVPATVRVFGSALSITVPQATTAIIFDLAGRPQRNLRLPDGETRVEGLPSGAYIVKFENGEVVKVIVTRSRT